MSKTELVDISNLDCIYLSYNESQAELFWAEINSMIPWAKRVHGIKGIDKAHKAAANASETERFVLIDGDNLPDWDFFNQTLRLDMTNRNNVFRWKAKNAINDLVYGNGGLSCWTKTFIQNMHTHEHSNSTSTQVEFCWEEGYVSMHDCWSTTYPNGSPSQAWRAGFREGVKLCLDRGTLPPVTEINEVIYAPNLKKLRWWMTVGRDVLNGEYAILGARMGLVYALDSFYSFDLSLVNDLNHLDSLFSTLVQNKNANDLCGEFNERVEFLVDWKLPELDATASKFFKNHVIEHKNVDIMMSELEYNTHNKG